MGEFGFGQGSYYPSKDPFGVDLHNSLWSSMFSTSIGPASFWWWSYLKNNDLLSHFTPLLTFCQQLPILSETFTAHHTGTIRSHKLLFPSNIETYYMINSSEDTIIGWCQDTAFCYQSLRWLTDSVRQVGDSTGYALHFVDDAVFDTNGYVYKMTTDKRPDPSSLNNTIIIPISNHPVGTQYQLTWFNTETGLPEGNTSIQQVVYYPSVERGQGVKFDFPAYIRDLQNHMITNTFGDAVFMLVLRNQSNTESQNKKQ